MKMFKYIFFFSILCTTLFFAQDEKGFPELKSQDIDGIIIGRTTLFDGKSLWGLIDGGADIYLEYGFNSLLFQNVELNNVRFRVEIYKMNSAESAFGIFSVSRFKCLKDDTLTKFICISQYQIQASIGKFYVSISKERGDQESKKVILQIFSKILSKTKEVPFSLPKIFQNKALSSYQNQIKLVKGNLGMQNGFPGWTDLFDGFSNYELYILPVENSNGFINVAQVSFSKENDAVKFQDKLKGEPQKKLIKALSSTELIFTETNMKDAESKKFIE
jgi:hypothetical protein